MLLVLLLTSTSKSAKTSFSDLYFLATDAQLKFLAQKLEFSIPDKNSIQIGNLIISNSNMKLFIDEKENLIAEGPLQLMVGSSIIIKDPLGKALWNHTIKNISEIQKFESHDVMANRKQNDSGRFQLDSIEKFRDKLELNSIFNYCIFNENKTNRFQICTPSYVIEKRNGKWMLKNPETTKNENTVVVNGVEVNDHGIIQFDKSVQSVAIAINLITGLSLETKVLPIELEFLDLNYDETNDEIELKLREKTTDKKNNLPWIAKVSLKNPSLYIEAFGQIPLRQELQINKSLLPKNKDRPRLEKSISKTYSSNITLTFKSQPNLKLKPATNGDSIKKEASKILWNINNLNSDSIKPHLIDIELNQIRFIGAYEVERAPSWILSLETGAGSVQSKSNSTTSTDLTETQSNTMTQFYFSKYFDSFFGADNSFMHLRWSLHLNGAQRSYTKQKATATDTEVDLSYRLNENFHHSESSPSLQFSVLSRSVKTSLTTESISSQWLGIKWTHDGPHNLKNIFLKSFLGDSHDFQFSYFGSCLNETCKKTTLITSFWQSRYDFKDTYFWSWKVLFQNSNTKSESLTQSINQYELLLGLGLLF